MPSTVSITAAHLAGWWVCRRLFCRGCLCWVPAQDGHAGTWVLLYPSVAGLWQAAGGATQMFSKGLPSEHWGGWGVLWKGGLSPFCLRKKVASEMFFFPPLFYLSSFVDCSVLREAKRWTNHKDCSSLKHRGGWNAGFQMPGLLFHHYSTSWTANREAAIIFVSCQKKLSSWKAGGVGGEHAGAEGRRK